MWQAAHVTEWETCDGDLVILRGHGWPHEGSLCPLHEVESPRVGDRMTMTFRHNRRGPGGDYSRNERHETRPRALLPHRRVNETG